MYIGKNKKGNECLIWDEEKKNRYILTFYGKVVVTKALIVSQVVYTATVVPATNIVINSWNKSVYAFLWSSKRERVKRNVCINKQLDGGLDKVDMESKINSFYLSWKSKLLDETTCRWKSLFKY